MPVTSADLVYAAIETRIKAAATLLSGGLLDGEVDPDDVYYTTAPDFMGGTLDQTVLQIIPGAPQIPHQMQAVGMVTEEFSVASWRRAYLDRAGRSSSRLHSVTRGVARLQDYVRRIINQNEFSSTLTIPAVHTRGSIPAESNDYPGWIMAQDWFRISYEMTWPSSAVTP